MLPPKCFSCSRMLCDIDLEYRTKSKSWEIDPKLTNKQIADKVEKLLNELHVHSHCCVSTVLTSVYLIDIII